MFEREDWTLFRSLATIGQKAGVHVRLIPRLVAKELVDNALDAGATCSFGALDGGGFYVQDDGEGIPGTDEEIAALFSIRRPLRSSKQLRLPTRGALGNGLRGVAGTVLASGGTLIVRTRGRSLRLSPQDDGSTKVECVGAWKRKATRVEVTFGTELDGTSALFLWARQAIELSGRGKSYAGRSSPWWYDSDSFWELLKAAGQRSARDLVAQLEGCHRKAAEVAAAFAGRQAASLTRAEAQELLSMARIYSPQVKTSRLGFVGRMDDWPGYALAKTIVTVKVAPGKLDAELPVVIEAWATTADEPTGIICVNRTPITAEFDLQRDVQCRSEYALFGCGLSHGFRVGKGRDFEFLVNVQTPHMPITSDGKAPDLQHIGSPLLDAMAKAARVARRVSPANGLKAKSQKSVIFEAIPLAAEKASGGGRGRFSQRQLFYKVRPYYLEAFRQEPDWNYFCRVVTEYEAALGHDITGMYRDTRGLLYHPHTGEEIPLGTLAVEQYRRPVWTFNKILYCEKEGFFPILKDARWAERHDCALVTSKGFASRAVRDVLDLLGETGEPLKFYCIHDGDGPGTMIYQALQQGTDARPARNVEIVNLGLDPEEAMAMGLDPEPVNRKGNKTVPVAAYVPDEWKKWLQENRVELNAMSTPQFLEWLDSEFAEEPGKVIPPRAVLAEQLAQEVEKSLRERITAEVLREGRIEERVAAAVREARPAVKAAASGLPAEVAQALVEEPTTSWTAPVKLRAGQLADGKRPPSKAARKKPA